MATLDWNPAAGAELLKLYAEPRGVVEIRRVIDERHAGKRRLDAMAFYALLNAFNALGGSITEMDIAAFRELDTPLRRQKRPRRNDVCFCGSGKKSKRCHPHLHEGSTLN